MCALKRAKCPSAGCAPSFAVDFAPAHGIPTWILDGRKAGQISAALERQEGWDALSSAPRRSRRKARF